MAGEPRLIPEGSPAIDRLASAFRSLFAPCHWQVTPEGRVAGFTYYLERRPAIGEGNSPNNSNMCLVFQRLEEVPLNFVHNTDDK
jgi:hypothetical protein